MCRYAKTKSLSYLFSNRNTERYILKGRKVNRDNMLTKYVRKFNFLLQKGMIILKHKLVF